MVSANIQRLERSTVKGDLNEGLICTRWLGAREPTTLRNAGPLLASSVVPNGTPFLIYTLSILSHGTLLIQGPGGGDGEGIQKERIASVSVSLYAYGTLYLGLPEVMIS